MGGPGALFWMWVTAIFGMASKYSEAFLAVRFRTTDANGQQSGGPQYYLREAIKGTPGRVLSIFFACSAVLASFGIGCMTQSNAVAAQLANFFGWSGWAVGLVLALCVGAVLLGGIESIGKVTAGFVPMMIVFYVGGCLYILAVNVSRIPRALGMVFHDAFTARGATGNFAGSTLMLAIQYGVARGIFPNESGMGSAAIAAAAARTHHPARQGLVSMTQTFIGTVTELTDVWTFADIANGPMAIPNLFGLLLLSGLIARETKAYLSQDPHLRRAGDDCTSVREVADTSLR